MASQLTVEKDEEVEAGKRRLPNGYSKAQIASAISPTYQELILFPTEQCNFRCTYCYEDFELGKMPENIQRALELYLDRRVPELQRLHLAWFGGEPLVAKDVVLRIARHAKQISDRFGVALSGHFTTNGYHLDQELAAALFELGQSSFQITLDGWGDHHDLLRRRADGAGTFHRIWSNLCNLRRMDAAFSVQVRVHVRRDNLENLPLLMEKYAEAFEDDPRFRLDFQHLRNLGGEGGSTVKSPVTLEELGDIAFSLMNDYRRALAIKRGEDVEQQVVERRQLTEEELKFAAAAGESAGASYISGSGLGEPYICYAAKPNSLLVRADGRLGKCTVALADSRNDLGYLRDDGTIHINSDKLHPWMRGLSTLSNAATGCPLVDMPMVDLPSPYPNGWTGRKVVPIIQSA